MGKTKIPKVFLVLSIIFFVLFFLNLYINNKNYLVTIDIFTIIPSTFILFSLSFISFMIFLFIISRGKIYRLLVIIISFISLLFISFLGLFASEKVNKYQKEGFVIYVQETRAIFSGKDKFYIKENILLARYIGSANQGEECNSTYYIEDGLFYIHENWESGSVDITEIPLK